MKKLLSRLAGMLYFTGCFLFLLSSDCTDQTFSVLYFNVYRNN